VHRSSSIDNNDHDWTVRIRQGDCRLAIDIEGDVRFDEAESTVVHVSRGGRFRVAEERDGSERELLARPGDDGLRITYELDGSERPFDAEGRAWLARLLPEVFRSTGLDAEGRVRRILQRGGVPALFAETRKIRSDHVQRIYLTELLEQGKPTEAQVREAAELGARDIDSDYDLAELLVAALAEHRSEVVVGPRFADACAAIESDYDLRRVLSEVIARARTNAPGEEALRCVRRIESDYDTAEVLVAAAQRWPPGRELPASYFVAAREMGSDYDRRRVLQAVTGRRPAPPADLGRVLAVADAFTSSYDCAELLVSVAEASPLDGELASAYRTVARGIASEYDRQRSLAALADGGSD
jgi:hypothetical protein